MRCAIPTVNRFPDSSKWGEVSCHVLYVGPSVGLAGRTWHSASVAAVLKPFNRPQPSLPLYRYYEFMREASNVFFYNRASGLGTW
jgi:hypothetical protein